MFQQCASIRRSSLTCRKYGRLSNHRCTEERQSTSHMKCSSTFHPECTFLKLVRPPCVVSHVSRVLYHIQPPSIGDVDKCERKVSIRGHQQRLSHFVTEYYLHQVLMRKSHAHRHGYLHKRLYATQSKDSRNRGQLSPEGDLSVLAGAETQRRHAGVQCEQDRDVASYGGRKDGICQYTSRTIPFTQASLDSDEEAQHLEQNADSAALSASFEGKDRSTSSRSDTVGMNRMPWVDTQARFPLLGSAAQRRKIDLSNVDVREREAAAVDGIMPTERGCSTTFRSNAGLRRILSSFMSRIPYKSCAEFICFLGRTDDAEARLLEVFDKKNIEFLRKRGYHAEDILSWAWVFSSRSSTQQIQRYVALSQDYRRQGLKQPPTFFPLQLLRLEYIDARSLRLLWTEVVKNFEDLENRANWDDDAAAIFLIRCIRHARNVDVAFCLDVVAFAPKLLPHKIDKLGPEAEIAYVRRLTHFYNRMLTLLALPAPHEPFRSVNIQQEAQLEVARYMYRCQPPIIINREGYRAFVHLQLRHAKTTDEQAWARAKAPSWPPWRRDQLGIEESVDYPGRSSRVMKVLQRMRESGYSPGDFEDAAQILAGWDTDKSPTIQVRRILNRRPMAWLRELVSKRKPDIAPANHGVWAARVAATRSVREAWLCFHTYMEATCDTSRAFVVYSAMFEKLLVQTLEHDHSSNILPGDGREVFSDPISSRDVVYVPSEPPTIEELYSQMLQDNIKPGGRLLSSLLNSASSPEHARQYIHDSSLGENKRDVLLHAEKYPLGVIRRTLHQLPDYLFASFLTALLRSNRKSKLSFQRPASLSTESEPSVRVNVAPFTYARQLLEISGTGYLPAYHAILTGLQQRSMAVQHLYPEFAPINIWKTALQVVELMNGRGLIPTPAILRTLSLIAQNVLLSTRKDDPDRKTIARTMTETIKCVFWFVLVGRPISEHDWMRREHFTSLKVIPAKSVVTGTLPSCKELEVLFLTFSILLDQQAVLSLLRWVVEGDRDNLFATNRPNIKRQMIASIRVAIENSWATFMPEDVGSDSVNVSEHATEAAVLCDSLGWASDEETEEFLMRRSEWRSNIRTR